MAKENGMDELGVNAILFGALGASEALPISEVTYLKAIEQVGVAVGSNIKAFRIGWDLIKSGKYTEQKAKPQQKWEEFIKERVEKLDAGSGQEYIKWISGIESQYPPRLWEILAEAVYRLIDYQDLWYAKKYLRELQIIYDIDREMKGGFKLTEVFAKNLALWMSYEDGIRVAETNLFRSYWPESKRLTVGQKPITTSFSGFLRLWLLTKLKFMRPYSYRYHKEHSLIKKYKNNVERFARVIYELGCLVAKSAQMIKGYGRVRRKSIDAFNRFLDNIITPLVEFEKKSRKGFHLTLDIGEKSLKLISTSTEEISKAEKLAQDVMKGKPV